MRSPVRTFAPAAALGAQLVAAACGDAGPNPGSAAVNVADDVFQPAVTTVAPGAQVTWTWTGANPHNVTWVDPLPGGVSIAASATQTTGTYSKTLSAAGTYSYYCTIHGTPTSGMTGKVTVK